ncbi:hypothetical protein [Burkholderia gladioli]|uniref:hypothetical protein n=1 Tax=Burkholderia gladioli TaxID=28095 RepID=UPI00163E9743|nr:hypothetical protein [Burkholderia gladioli]
MPRTDVPLKDGRYKAACRERSLLAAAPNGHSQVFPHFLVVVKKGRAHFYIDSVEVWNCNGAYAATHFDLEKS